jgi:hypothetical protein
MNRILVCDINIKKQGHYIGFNQYILDHFLQIEKTNPGIHFSFLYNREAQHLLQVNESFPQRIFYIDRYPKNSAINRYLMLLKIKKIAVGNKADHLLFMDLDQYQLPFFLIKFPVNISGILFRPHHRITSSYRRIKKRISEKLIAKKKSFKNIYILSDAEGVGLLNNIHRAECFTFLPDPIFNYLHPSDYALFKKKKSAVFQYLVFGSINERKNISNIISAYGKANIPFASELLIMGPAKNEYAAYLNNIIAGIDSIDNIRKKVKIKNDFVTNKEMDLAFCHANVCLVIYKDFFGSSGVLGRASLHHLKVIGPNAGLLQKLIDGFKLGITADPDDINDIAKSMENIISFEINDADMNDFYTAHSPEKFLHSLTNTLIS